MSTIAKHHLYIFKTVVLFFLFLSPCIRHEAWAVSSWLFTSENDLPNSLINDLVEDTEGNIWIATEDGLCRYNGSYFYTYRAQSGNPHSLAHNLIRCLFVDSEGHLFVGSEGGLQLYRPASDDFSEPAHAADNSIIAGNVTQVMQDRRGQLHVCGNVTCDVKVLENGELELFYNALTYKVDLTLCMIEDEEGVFWVCQKYSDVFQLLPDSTIVRLEEDGHGVVSSRLCLGSDGAVYLSGERSGLYRFDRQQQRFVLVSDPELHFVACALRNSQDGHLLVGTDGNGLYTYDYATSTLDPYYYDSYQLTPSTQKVHAILEDSNRSLWLGLYQKGVIATTSQMVPFRYIGHKTELHNGIGDKCVTSILRSADGTVWVASDNGGVYHIDTDGNSLGAFPANYSRDGVPQTVMSLFEDSHGRLWLGAFHRGIGVMDRKSGRCTYYPIRGQHSTTNVYGFTEDGQHRIWAAGLGIGPLLWDERHHEMVPVCRDGMALWATSVLFDETNRHLFFGSYNGLNEIDPDDPEFRVTHHLESYIIHSLVKYDEHTLCLSTSTGLLLYDYQSHEVRSYDSSQGLPGDAVCAAVVVSPNEIWASSNRGLSRITLPEGEISNYTIYDGLQSNEFYNNVFMQEPDGTVWFGGMEGITLFNPSEIEKHSLSFKVRITHRGENTIQMAIVPLLYTHRARYSYSLDGSDWIALPHGTNTVALPKMSSGTHHFRYRASLDGSESDEQVLDIVIPFPWYKQGWFLLSFVLLLLVILAVGSRHLYQLRRDKLLLARHEQMEAINDAKLQFFTNISHEIRTPMTLIVSPLEKLISEEDNPQRKHTYGLMKRNANRILGLINQLLDLRKIDKNQMQLLCAETELAPYLEDLVQNFSDVADMRQQNLSFVSSGAASGLKAWIDINNFDKIVVNLISNALKYTPQHGRIEVCLAQQEASPSFPEGSFSIMVTDSGIGIAPEDRKHIFERFYQVRNSKGKYGTGIGLHLTMTLVQLHHGTIEVENNPEGEGTRFVVTLPLGSAFLTPEQKTVLAPKTQETAEKEATDAKTIAAASLSDDKEDSHGARHSMRRRVLVVDDDDEIRSYLSKQLSEYYYVNQCSNGREALDMILRHVPDLVISDVMMPEMDGNELCKSIRNNVLISHVPIILLTARSRQEDLMLSLDLGADAYLAKPFNIDVLLKMSQNVIRNHERLKNTFSGQQSQNLKVEIEAAKTPDERLIERINRVLSDNISNPSLSAEMVADMVGLSRVHLYRKLKELTNQSARDYIRNMRIIKAAELLNRKVAIGEVAAKVGYPDQRNFSTAFKSIYGITPSEYMERHLNASETSPGDSETASSVSSGTL